MFYAAAVGAVAADTGFITTRATKGAELYWYWQGNTFFSGGITDITNNAKIYAWYDQGSSTNACRLINTTPSIHNYYTYNSPPIYSLTPVQMYGQLKITEPQYWNRS